MTSGGSSSSFSSGGAHPNKTSSDLGQKAGPVKSQSVPPLCLPTTCIEYEQFSVRQKAPSAPISASSSRSESPMSDRYCGKCSSLISLHLRTIESDGELMRTTSTQTRPQSRGKSKKRARPERASAGAHSAVAGGRKSSRNSLEEVSPSRKLKRSLPIRSYPTVSRTTAFESSSSNESLHSST